MIKNFIRTVTFIASLFDKHFLGDNKGGIVFKKESQRPFHVYVTTLTLDFMYEAAVTDPAAYFEG